MTCRAWSATLMRTRRASVRQTASPTCLRTGWRISRWRSCCWRRGRGPWAGRLRASCRRTSSWLASSRSRWSAARRRCPRSMRAGTPLCSSARNTVESGSRKRSAPWRQVVADATQEVHLAEAALGVVVGGGAVVLSALNAAAAPAVGGAVGEGAEHRQRCGRVVWGGREWESGPERVGARVSEVRDRRPWPCVRPGLNPHHAEPHANPGEPGRFG